MIAVFSRTNTFEEVNNDMKNTSLAILLLLLSTFSSFAQQTLTTADYQLAEAMLSYNTNALVDNANVRPNWLSGDKFWYRILTSKGSEFILVDAVRKTRKPLFDQQKAATSLSSATGKQYDAFHLPYQNMMVADGGQTVLFYANGKRWKLNISSYQVTEDSSPAKEKEEHKEPEVFSPDGSKTVFIRNYNLWLRDVSTHKETQLTTDGIKDFGYATDNAGWKHSDAPIVKWSPDSKKIATFQQDQRKVGDMYLVTTNVGKPHLQQWKYPLPGDSNIAMIQRVVIDVDNAKVIRLQVAPDPHRASLSDDISSAGDGLDDVEWTDDDKQLAFVSTSRDHKVEKFRIADAATGAVREIFEESVTTQYESGQDKINWHYLPQTNEVIWYSERDNWGHLYLFDATTGKLKNQITKGDFVVTQLLKVDTKKRMIYFLADGYNKQENPYFTHLFAIGFDGKKLAPLTPEEGNHQITFSPDEKYMVDAYSQPDIPAITVLRSIDGKLITTLEKADAARLSATGWKPPIPITVKAHDGQTDLYGLLFLPTHLDSSKKYPVIDYIYPGPQGGSIGSWSFLASRGDNQALAELGFVVVEIEGGCNPLRSKSYHDLCYGNMAENTLPDQIAGIQQLAQKYAFMDTGKVGIWGHSGGGFATAAALFRYPDFFKVGISESGNHDNRNYEDDWGERYIGLETKDANGKSNYEAQANQLYAKNLKGKLMLAHGLLDDNVPPYNTLLVIDALEKANKDYDLVVFPNSHHGYGEFSYYMMRRRWDYFVKNLMNATPPKEYELKPKVDPRNSQ